MADIELVVKIPEEIYKDIMIHNREMREGGKSAYYFEELIQHGTPLPKGHGNLKDVGKCDRKLFYQQCGGENSLITVKTAFDMLLSLPTIIEADRSVEDGNVD